MNSEVTDIKGTPQKMKPLDMKLLLLLLPIFALGYDEPDRYIIIRPNRTAKQEPRYGHLSSENKAKLTKEWGLDADARKARLENILKKAAKTIDKPSPDLKERLKNIVPLKTTKPNKNAVTDLFEVNNRLGLSDYFFQGDIHLSERQLNEIEGKFNGRTKRQASSIYNKWTANTVNFYFDASINDRKKASVRAAHAYLTAHTCINFVEDATAANRVKVYNGGGCSSAIGMEGGEQLLSLGDGCEVIGTSAHEFAHALGFFHTQSRSDRNTFVDVDTSDPNAVGNFALLGDNENFLYTPYEYGSFMHYSANAFTSKADSFSIVSKDPKYMHTMGNRQISFYDIQMINYHYNCNVTCTPANSAVCQNGGYPNPRNCAECNCPLGYGGALCDQRPAGCGESLAATPNWQKKEFEFGDKVDDQNIRDVFTMCHHWITAPQGKKIQVKITSMFNEQCQHACPFNGIEIKADDKEKTNPRFCCPEFNDQIIESKLNPTPVVAFNRFWYNTFEIEYRYLDDDVTTTPADTTTTEATTTKAETTTTPADTTTTPAAANVPTTTKDAAATTAKAETTTVAAKTTTTVAPVPPKNCVNPLIASQLPLLRLYNHAKLRHLFHFDLYVADVWQNLGYKVEGGIGKVLETNTYLRNKAEIDKLCPGIVKLRNFYKNGVQFMTTHEWEAQQFMGNGWAENRPVGYCASTQSCGANKNLRLVGAHDGGNMVFSTDSHELGILNTQNPRYVGTLSKTICWLF